MNKLSNCTLCPRVCGVNRANGQVGFCGASDKLKIARASLHEWEEPCISGIKGSGTVFFSHCSMKCIYCQNYSISTKNFGAEITVEKLCNIFLSLQQKGAHNINLVTPTHYVPQIVDALKLAKNNGLIIPIIYNSSGYETKDNIKLLDKYIDIYLPDLKYFDDKLAIKYSKAPNYFKYASEAIDEMVKQVGPPVFDDNGLLLKGVVIRHLLLPTHLFDSMKIIHYIYNTYHDDVIISIMNQYTPIEEQIKNFPELNKKVSNKDYDKLIDYAINLGVKNAYIQEGETQKVSFIPSFDLEGIN